MKRILILTLALVLLLTLAVTPVMAAKGPKTTVWHVPEDFTTIQAAVDSVDNGDTIIVGSGSYAGAVVTKTVTIKGTDGAMITSGVPYNEEGTSALTTAFLLKEGADGAEISHLIIPNDVNNGYFFAVFSRGVDDVSIYHLTITNSVQAISNYNGSEWDISHNKITGINPVNGGGIGIMINAWDGTRDGEPDDTEANDNVIAHNTTEGIVGDVGFSGPGILLSSGHGAGQWPGGTLTGNIVYKNRCTHTGSNGVGFEVDDVPWEKTSNAAITGNTVAFNDFRRSTYPFVWYGDEELNYISRNFVDTGAKNRGEGKDGLTPPEIFK